MLRLIAGTGPEGASRVPYLPVRWVGVGEDPAMVERMHPPDGRGRCAPRPGEVKVQTGGRGGHAIAGVDVVDRGRGGGGGAAGGKMRNAKRGEDGEGDDGEEQDEIEEW